MTKRTVALYLVLIASLVSAAAARIADGTGRRDANWRAPAGASSKTNPLANRTDAANGGRRLFIGRCNTCHGEDGRGSDRAPDLTVNDVQLQSDGALFWKISGGNTRTGMPAFSFLPESQRWQLVLYLRELGRQ